MYIFCIHNIITSPMQVNSDNLLSSPLKCSIGFNKQPCITINWSYIKVDQKKPSRMYNTIVMLIDRNRMSTDYSRIIFFFYYLVIWCCTFCLLSLVKAYNEFQPLPNLLAVNKSVKRASELNIN